MKYTKICFSLLEKANSDIHNLVVAVEFPCVSYKWYFWYILYIIHGLVAPPLKCDKTFQSFSVTVTTASCYRGYYAVSLALFAQLVSSSGPSLYHVT